MPEHLAMVEPVPYIPRPRVHRLRMTTARSLGVLLEEEPREVTGAVVQPCLG